jgi:conjugative relaxase-like TrwC/TraI family protein
MISIKPITNSGTAALYFRESDYYTKEQEGGVDSEWNGKGAETLGLEGPVSPDSFKTILDGKLPDGQQLGRATKDGQIEHAKGWDLTFSAPKSVSIMALVAGDTRLIGAHQQAVKTALAFAEKHYVRTRVTENGITRYEQTGNATFASFLHKTSRALDPQLHTHNPIMNATLSKDGKWRSIDSSAIYENSMAIGGVYKMQLATLVKQLGYETEKGKHGNIEIKGVDKELMAAFSKRRQEILKAKEEFGYRTAKGMDKAAVRTRSAKVDANPEQLSRQWSETARSQQSGLKTILENSIKVAAVPLPQRSDNGNSLTVSISKAIKNLSERHASFSHNELVREVHRWTESSASVQAIEKTIDNAVASKSLSRGLVKGFTGYTTPDQIKLEQSILRTVGSGIDKMRPFSTSLEADQKIADSGLNKGQANAFKLAMTTKDNFIGVQGFAGTGKTYLLSTYREAMEEKGKSMMGFAWTHTAVSILEKESGLASNTVMRLVSDITNGKTDAYKNLDSIVIDEASLVGAKPIAKIFGFAQQNNIKVMMLGDKLQHESVEWGKPFEQLTASGMKTAVMQDIIRQKDSPNLLSAVHSLISNSPSKAFKHIQDRVHEVSSVDERKQLMVDKMLKLRPEERSQHLLLIPDNATRSEVNDRIQDGLVERGELSPNFAPITALSNAGFTEFEKGHAQFYEAGQFVVFNTEFKSLRINKNDMFQVVGRKDETVTLKGKEGYELKWNPSKIAGFSGKVEVYQPQEKKFHEGELVKSTRTNKEEGLKIGLEGEVTKIDQDTQSLTIVDKHGKEHLVGFNEASHWDLKYATTVYSSQGATVKDVTLHLESHRINLTNLKTAYVGITRSKGDIDIYVDNQKSVTDALFHRSGASVSAMEASGLNAKAEIDYGAMSFSEKVQQKIKNMLGIRNPEIERASSESRQTEDRRTQGKDQIEMER